MVKSTPAGFLAPLRGAAKLSEQLQREGGIGRDNSPTSSPTVHASDVDTQTLRQPGLTEIQGSKRSAKLK
jgi:hypothetical protein